MISCRLFLLSLLLVAFPALTHAQEYRFVEVGGYDMRVRVDGFEDRRPDEPVFIFENGSVSPIESWSEFPEHVADLGPVLLYDRATLGQSEWDGELGTAEHVTERLWALLDILDIQPPYVIIGWSWGGDLAIQHARAHPDEVTGLILIDPPLQSRESELAILDAMGVAREAHDVNIARMRAEMADLPEAMRADVLPIYDIFAGTSALSFDVPPHIGVSALVAGFRPDPRPQDLERHGAFPYDFQQHHRAKTRHRALRLGNIVFAAEHGGLFVLPDAGHALHRHHPDLVIAAIREAVGEKPGN